MDEAVATIVAAVISGCFSAATLYYIHRVKQGVETMNESTMGQLAAADETRRIEHIPEGERTAKEQRHVDTAPNRSKES